MLDKETREGTVILQLRIKRSDKMLLHMIARGCGQTISEFVRTAAIEKATGIEASSHEADDANDPN